MLRALLASFAFAAVLGLAAPVVPGVSTHDAQAQRKKKKKKPKVYDFTGDDISGELIRPDGMGINARKFASHTSLIRLRTNFIAEILKSAEDL
jgi:hypothetical protein